MLQRRLLSLLVICAVLAGCQRDARLPAPNASTAGSNAKSYPMHGVVISADTANHELTLKHDAIPGLMEAMTMSYPVDDPAVLSELHPGDRITATIVAQSGSDGQTDMRLKDVVIVAQARPDYLPAVQYHVPAPGDAVPDFSLLNQSGRMIRLAQFRGKVVALTFIYTRCPLSDYCPRMSHNFAEIDKALATDPKLDHETHLLSVSFDPAYDTPKVLKSYGEAMTGRYTQETFQHWDFAAPPPVELPKMEQFFDVGVTPGQNGMLQHSLSTVVIGKDGKVVAFWPSNDWTVTELLAKVKAAAG